MDSVQESPSAKRRKAPAGSASQPVVFPEDDEEFKIKSEDIDIDIEDVRGDVLYRY